VLSFIYDEMLDNLQTDEFDVIRILRLCVNAHWPEGFMTIINATTTDKIFMHSSLDFKEDFV
jgi:hypothetical protein